MRSRSKQECVKLSQTWSETEVAARRIEHSMLGVLVLLFIHYAWGL